MPSSATLTTLRDRVESLLLDVSNVTWATGILDEGIRIALEEYSRARPLAAVGTVTPTAATREVSVSSLTGLINIERVWFPYTAATPEYPPTWVDWATFWNAGSPTLFLKVAAAPDGVDVARVFYAKLHTLNGLDSAVATTYSAADDGLLVLGAAGFACLSRAADAVETQPAALFGTRNYEDVGKRLLEQFRAGLAHSRGATF
jgi:hypothetical protein